MPRLLRGSKTNYNEKQKTKNKKQKSELDGSLERSEEESWINQFKIKKTKQTNKQTWIVNLDFSNVSDLN